MQGPLRLNSLTPRLTVGALDHGGGGGRGEEQSRGEAEECKGRRERAGEAGGRTHVGANVYNDPLTAALRVLRETQAAPLNPSYKKFTKRVRSDLGSALQASGTATDCGAPLSGRTEEISGRISS